MARQRCKFFSEERQESAVDVILDMLTELTMNDLRSNHGNLVKVKYSPNEVAKDIWKELQAEITQSLDR